MQHHRVQGEIGRPAQRERHDLCYFVRGEGRKARSGRSSVPALQHNGTRATRTPLHEADG